MDPAVSSLLTRLQDQPSHTGSLIVTIFGDAIMPRGGVVALASLLEICAAFGIGPGVVRTAISRLTADGWVSGSRQGRMSYYCIPRARKGEYVRAERHIFGPGRRQGVSRLSLVLLEPSEARDAQRVRLSRLGFVGWQGWMLAPERPLPRSLAAQLPVLTADAPAETLRMIAARAWKLDDRRREYQDFIEAFGRLARPGFPIGSLSELDALVARLLLVHDFRRIALRDPFLPKAFLPPDWAGTEARRLCARLYPALLPASEAWLDHNARTESGALAKPSPSLYRRFQSHR
jgi:phenylacetic acid degradation operon negative regulatory protein